jgi:transcriptional regulator with XRE-family HTH domain
MKDITREELLASKEYWTADIQMKLFAEVEHFMESRGMNRTQFAEYLGCTKGYVTQLLSGDFDNKISKLVELSLAIGKIPEVVFKDTEQFLVSDEGRFEGWGDAASLEVYSPKKDQIRFTILKGAA